MLQLRPYQIDGLDAVWNYFQEGNAGNPLLAWPTGTGKSVVPAVFIESVMRQWPNQRFLMITHVKELIEQNYKVLLKVWFNAPVGIYSAGLKQKDYAHSIVYGGIQSMIKNPMQFGFRDIIFIDEAHLISQEDSSMYLTFIAAMKLINPNLKVIGLTATPFRMGQGYITDGGLFTDIVHDLTSMDNFNKLISDGYLAPLIPLRTKTELNVNEVSVQKGEFVASSLQKAVDKQEITFQGLREVVDAGANRNAWLLFASGIEHAEHIAEMLGSFGIDCAPIHSKRPSNYNDDAINAFKSGELKSLVNYGKLTTGFDYPSIDLIGMFRPTLSVPLWIQMLGRGTRPVYPAGMPLETVEQRLEAIRSSHKQNCLVMDFARNTPRLGPINDPQIPRKKGEGQGEVPIKICDNCGAYNHTRVQFCCQCGNEFEFKIKIKAKAGTEELIRTNDKIETPIIELFDVDRVSYHRHIKIDRKTKTPLSAPMIKVQYMCGLRMFNEWVLMQGTGLNLHKAHEWWRMRTKENIPVTTDEALSRLSELRVPRKIEVHVNLKYPEIKRVIW